MEDKEHIYQEVEPWRNGKVRTPPQPVRASNWKVLPSQGTEAHSVLLLKTLLAPVWEGVVTTGE